MRVIGLAGWSGAGKTTLLVRLLPLLSARGLRVSTLKHAHHSFDVDRPGKDSHAHREAGAIEVLVASGKRWALMHELRDAPEPSLAELLGHMSAVDLVVVEGFKHAPHPKIEVHRSANGKPWLHTDDPAVIGLVTDAPYAGALPCAALDDADAAAGLVARLARPLPEVLAALGRNA
jgi:molybdopterin-guanine dinucleotide biosynthesis protein B